MLENIENNTLFGRLVVKKGDGIAQTIIKAARANPSIFEVSDGFVNSEEKAKVKAVLKEIQAERKRDGKPDICRKNNIDLVYTGDILEFTPEEQKRIMEAMGLSFKEIPAKDDKSTKTQQEQAVNIFEQSRTPTEPATPAATTKAATPAVTAEAATPAVTAEAATPAVTTEAATPAVTAEPATPAGTTEAATPAATAEPATPAVTTEAATPAATAEPATPAATTEAATPAASAKPATPAATAKPAVPTASAKPATPAATTQPKQPAQQVQNSQEFSARIKEIRSLIKELKGTYSEMAELIPTLQRSLEKLNQIPCSPEEEQVKQKLLEEFTDTVGE